MKQNKNICARKWNCLELFSLVEHTVIKKVTYIQRYYFHFHKRSYLKTCSFQPSDVSGSRKPDLNTGFFYQHEHPPPPKESYSKISKTRKCKKIPTSLLKIHKFQLIDKFSFQIYIFQWQKEYLNKINNLLLEDKNFFG